MTAEPRFDEIRAKLPLTDIRQITFAMLADEARPSTKERKVIAAWFDEHEACRKSGDEWRRTKYLPEVYALFNDAEMRLEAIGADLYNRKLTYGGANKLVQQLAADLTERATALARIYQARIAAQKALAAQQEQQRQAATAQAQALEQQRQAQAEALRLQQGMAILNAMRVTQLPAVQFHPMPTNPTINCTSRPIGSTVYTNCQ